MVDFNVMSMTEIMKMSTLQQAESKLTLTVAKSHFVSS